jgi:hypothetical protein
MSKESDFCPKCAAPWVWDMLTDGKHDVDLCTGRQLLTAQKQVKKLKAEVDAWKDSWFHLREIIGKLWWHHPAIDSDQERAYYQAQLEAIKKQKQHT